MSYFSKFPRTFLTIGEQPYYIEDFLTRISLSADFRKNVVYLDDYFVRDKETPELVSQILYGTPNYHWVILLVNDIINVNEEWPLPDSKVTNLIYLKYDFEVSVPDESEYNVNDIIQSNSGGKFTVTKIETGKVFLRSQVGKTYLTVASILENVTTETDGLTVTSIIDPEEATHHFYDPEIGYIVDEGYSVTTVSVSNYDYEVTANDNKRTVKVLSPNYIGLFTSNFARLIR